MGKEEIIKILTDYADVLHIKSFALDFIRQLGWWLIKALCNLCDFFYDVLTSIYKALDFTTGDSLISYSKALMPWISCLLVISIMLLGYYMIVKRTDARVNLVQNLVLIMLIVTALPQITGYMADLTAAATKSVEQEAITQEASPSFKVIQENVIDLKTADKQDMPSYADITDGKKKRNSLTSQKKIRYVDINEYMDYKNDNELKNPDLWKSKLTVDGDGKASITDMGGGLGSFFGLANDKYYRYSVNWWTVIITLAVSCIALFFMSLKVSKIIWEIAAHQLIGPFIAVTDLASGQRMKEFLRSLVSLFAVLFMIMLMYGLYFLGMSYINSFSVGSQGVNAVAKIIMQMALAWMMIDGANIIERVTGVDAGLKSGYQAVIGALAAGKAVKGIGKAAGTLVNGSKSKGAATGLSSGGLKGAAGKAIYTAGRVAVGKKGVEGAKARVQAAGDKIKQGVSDKIEDVTDGQGAYGAIRKAADKADSKKMGPDNRGGRAFYDERKTGRVSGIHQQGSGDSKRQQPKTGKASANSKTAGKAGGRNTALGSERIRDMKKSKSSGSTLAPERNDHLKDTFEKAEELSRSTAASGSEKRASSAATERSRKVSPEIVSKKASRPARRDSLKQERNMGPEIVKEKQKLQKPVRKTRRGGDDI